MSWLFSVLALAAVAGSLGEMDKVKGTSTRVFRNDGAPKYWRAIDGSVHKEGDQIVQPEYPDKVQVMSSALRILPKRTERVRAKRSDGSSWRVPREYQFVTRDERPRSPRLIDPIRSSASTLFPEGRSYYRDDSFSRRNSQVQPKPPNRRIIYYATLPEIVRRPGEWTPPRPIGYSIPPRDNEITRVQSGVIDVTGGKNSYPTQSYSPSTQQELTVPKFTIIDAEPPYRQPIDDVPSRYDRGRYDDRYGQNRFDINPFERNRFEPRPNRFDYRDYYDRFDYRNYIEPHRFYEEPRYPPPRQVHASQPLTVVRKPLQPIDNRRPLDVRPLDPIRDTTRGSSTTSKPSTTTTTTSNPISSFERTFKY